MALCFGHGRGHNIYGVMMSHVRCRLAFALLRSAIMCIRDSGSVYIRPVNSGKENVLIKRAHLIMERFLFSAELFAWLQH